MGVERTSGWTDAKEVVAGTPEWRHPQRPPLSGQPMSGVVFGCRVEAGSGLGDFLDCQSDRKSVLNDDPDLRGAPDGVQAAKQVAHGSLESEIALRS